MLGGMILTGEKPNVPIVIVGASILGLSLGVLVGYGLGNSESLPLASKVGRSSNKNDSQRNQWYRCVSDDENRLCEESIKPIDHSLLKLIRRYAAKVVMIKVMGSICPIHSVANPNYRSKNYTHQRDDVTLTQTYAFAPWKATYSRNSAFKVLFLHLRCTACTKKLAYFNENRSFSVK
jgi:hypothetical protein